MRKQFNKDGKNNMLVYFDLKNSHVLEWLMFRADEADISVSRMALKLLKNIMDEEVTLKSQKYKIQVP